MKAWQKKKIVDACERAARDGLVLQRGVYMSISAKEFCLCPLAAVYLADVYKEGKIKPTIVSNDRVLINAESILRATDSQIFCFMEGFDSEGGTNFSAPDWRRFGVEVRNWIFPQKGRI